MKDIVDQWDAEDDLQRIWNLIDEQADEVWLSGVNLEDEAIEAAGVFWEEERGKEDKAVEKAGELWEEGSSIEYEAVEKAEDYWEESQWMDQILEGVSNPFDYIDLSALKGGVATKFKLKKIQLNFFAFINYLPSRYKALANNEDLTKNKIVYGFKEGNERISKEVASLLAKTLLKNIPKEETIFMVIPASTKIKNDVRFKNFTNYVCDATNLENGFDAITINQDREQYKGKIHENKVKNLHFNLEKIKNRHIVLFDDVITSGQSFNQIADKLIKIGAKKVTGLFLAKTVKK